MRIPGVGLRVLAAFAAMACVGVPTGSRAQISPTPPGAVGMDNGAAKPDTDPVVAEVADHVIHLSELGDTIRAMPGGGAGNSLETLYPMALQRVVERAALVMRAHAEGVASDPTVARHAQEAADQVLENAYLHYAAAKLVTDDMLSARYDAEFKGKPGPEEVHGRVILVPTEAEAQDIIGKLAAGADFATLAHQFSKDATAVKGGDLGFLRRGMLGPETGAVLFAMRPGEVTPFPVRTAAGWFVLWAEARQPGPAPTFAEVKDQLQVECERAEVPKVVAAALTSVSIRTYDMTGH